MFEAGSVYTYLIIFLLLLVSAALLYFGYQLGFRRGQGSADQQWQEKVPAIRQDAIGRSRAVLGGKFSENLAPYLPGFPFLPTECRFLGNPVDFIVFAGSDAKNIQEVIFVEVKSGKAGLSGQERRLKETIEAGRVRYYEYRVDKSVTG